MKLKPLGMALGPAGNPRDRVVRRRGPALPVPEIRGTIAARPVQQDWVYELGRLNALRLQGALTDEEFTKAKDRLLSAGSPREPAAG